MTVISPNSISGITSLSCTSDSLSIHDSGGNLVRTLITGGGDVVTGVLTVSQIGNATDTLTIPGNLTVQGTRTILNTDELNINDKLVGIASTATPSSLSQDNAGIIIYGKHNVDFKYEVKKAAVGLNTALCVAGIVTAMSGLNSPSDIKTTAGTINVKSGSSINTNSDTAAHGALHKNTNSGEFAIVSGGTGGNNYLSFYTSASGAPSEKLKITHDGKISVGTAVSIHANGNLGITGIMTASSFRGDGSNLTGISVGLETGTHTTTNGVCTLDLSKQDHHVILAGISTISCQNGTAGDSHTVRIVNSGITTVGFSTYFLWPSGGVPSIPTTSGTISLISFTVHHVAGIGTQLLAGASLDYS